VRGAGRGDMKIAVLGFAHGHVGVYCDQWTKSGEVSIVAGWDHDESRAASAREKYGIEVFAKPQAVLDRADAIVIGAETSMHAELVELAANAKKPIVLQKPLALTLEQADRIVAAVERNRVPFTLAWQMRVDPQNLEMKRMIESGAIGRVYMVRRRHGLSTHVWPGFENTWHVKPELNRGMWADDASHAIDFCSGCSASRRPSRRRSPRCAARRFPDDHGIAVFRYADGTFAEVVSSFTVPRGREHDGDRRRGRA
jgi:predicted dehydrogenase